MAPQLGYRIAKADGESSGFPALRPQKGFRDLFGNEESKLREESVGYVRCFKNSGPLAGVNREFENPSRRMISGAFQRATVGVRLEMPP